MSAELKSIEEVISITFKNYNLRPEHVRLICSALKPLKLNPGQRFSEAGKICKRLGILVNGLMYAAYETDDSKNENVSRFFYLPQNMIVTSFESFYNRKPSNESITAIEDSVLFYIERDALYELYKSIPEMNLIGREIAEQSYIQALQRIHSLQTMTTDEKVADFLEKNPSLANRLKANHLTSYLGANRNAISRYFKGKRKNNFATKVALE